MYFFSKHVLVFEFMILFKCYVPILGMTELGGIVAMQLIDTTSGSCGIVATNCEIKIVDPDTGVALGANQSGELWAKSWSVMTGYFKNPESTKSILDKDGNYDC